MKQPTLKNIDRVSVAEIDVGRRLRPVSEAGVESLLASIAEVRVMKDAIHVRAIKGGALRLIAGAHRLEAARRLGWTDIEAKVWTDVTDDWARMMEIDDNLAGAEMNALDTALFLAERKRLYEKLHPETRQAAGAALVAKRWDTADTMSVVSFATATAEKFGVSDRHIRRLVAIGDALTPDQIRWLRSSPNAVTLSDLQVLSKMPDAHQRSQVCIALSNASSKSASAARQAIMATENGAMSTEKDPVEAAFKALAGAWTRAPMAAKKRFLFENASAIWEAQNKGVPLSDWREADE